MNELIDRLDEQQTIAMLIEIDNNYRKITMKIPKPKYDQNGIWINEREIKTALKKMLPQLELVWSGNYNIIEKYSKLVLINNYIPYDLVKYKLEIKPSLLSVQEWNDVQDKLLEDRQKKIKIKQVIKGNVRSLNNDVQNLVNEMYRNGYSWVQTQKALQKKFEYNKWRAKRIAITEKNYYKSEAQLKAIQGLNVYKTWIHKKKVKEPRIHHLEADKQVVRGANALFNIGGKKTQAPQHFGEASEDINCHCTMRIDLANEIDLAPKEIKEAINKFRETR